LRQRQRKLVGTVILLVFLTVYSVIAAFVGAAVLPGASGLVQLLYYVVAGLLWTVPAGALIGWMQRPDADPVT
jgi:hypothetical protein